MAGLYIPGMKMPKCCGDCPFRFKANPEENECMADHHVFEETFGRLMNRRDENCPIIPVLDHGRLGDLDKLEQAMRNRKNFVGRWSDPDCLVADAPTIIPAEEGDAESLKEETT